MNQKQINEPVTAQVNDILSLSERLVEEDHQNMIELISLAEQLQHEREHSVYKQPYTVNLFEHYNSVEPVTSWALAEILKYNVDGNFVLLSLFAERFLSDIGFDVSLIKHPTIIAEKEGHIDVQIKEPNSYAIIIENKVKGAGYKRNQLARYINQFQKKGYKDEQIFIVLLPKYCSSKLDYLNSLDSTIWCLPSDDEPDIQDENNKGIKYKKDYRQSFGVRTVVIHKEITEWFINECLNKIPESEIIIKSFLIQFSDFLNSIYNNRDNKKLTEEMEQYLRERLLDSNDSAMNSWRKVNQKIEEIDNLKKEMENLRSSVYGEVIDEWYEQLREEWSPDLLKREPKQNFGIFIQGVWCGCWCETDNGGEPHWGFWDEDYSDRETKKKMVEEILDFAQMFGLGASDSAHWIQWNRTQDGANDCRNLYNAAVKLGYLKI